MANKTRSELKQYFETGKKPTQGEYADLIDSFVSRLDDDYVATLPNATTTQKGIVEQATIAESQSGTDNTHFVTPKGTKRAIETFAPALSPVQSVNDMTGDITIDLGTDSGWQTATLMNGILNNGGLYQQARYRKKNGVVYIEGLVKGGTASGNVTIFKLPLNFRPNKRIVLNSVRGGNQIHRTDINSNGDVVCYSYSAAYTSISGISFLVD